MAQRIGPKMAAVLEYVAAHPGCTKLAAANYAWGRPFGRQSYRYGPVNRCINAGLIDAEKQHGPIALRHAAGAHPGQHHREALEAAAVRCETEGTRDAASAASDAANAAAYAAAKAAYAEDRDRILTLGVRLLVAAQRGAMSDEREVADAG